jgi:hypothetical protein
MQAVIFKSLTKHGTHQFLPGVSLGFEDEEVAHYCVAAGWASLTDEEPIHVYGKGEVQCGSGNGLVDPATRHNESGLLVSDLIQKGATANV